MQDKDKIVIQDEISVSPEFVEERISHYNNMNPNFRIGFGGFYGGKEDIIREIKMLSAVGKDILMMHYRFINSDFYKQNKEKIEGKKNGQ